MVHHPSLLSHVCPWVCTTHVDIIVDIYNNLLWSSFILVTEEDSILLKEFLSSQRSGRRKAICREIEKTMNTFKVNGARMSLCHMRAELGGHNKFGRLEEEVEEVVSKPLGKCSRFELPFTPIRYYLNYKPLFKKLAHASGQTRNPDENWVPKRKFRRTYLFLFLRVYPNRFFDSYMYKIVEFPPENAKRYQNPWFLPLSKTARM